MSWLLVNCGAARAVNRKPIICKLFIFTGKLVFKTKPFKMIFEGLCFLFKSYRGLVCY